MSMNLEMLLAQMYGAPLGFQPNQQTAAVQPQPNSSDFMQQWIDMARERQRMESLAGGAGMIDVGLQRFMEGIDVMGGGGEQYVATPSRTPVQYVAPRNPGLEMLQQLMMQGMGRF